MYPQEKPKVLSSRELLERFNAERAGQNSALQPQTPSVNTDPDIEDLFKKYGGVSDSAPKVPEAKPVAEAKTEQYGWENANREIIDQEWDDKNIFEKAGAGWRKGVKYLKGGLQNFTADVMPKIGQIGSTLSGGAYTDDDIIEALSPVKTRAIKNMDEAAAIQGKGLVFETSQFMPQMVGAVAAMAAAPVTGGTSASAVPAMLGMGNIAALSGSVIGNTLYEVDKYAAEKGKDIPESTKWSVALLAGTAEFAAEKIRLGQYLPKGTPNKLLTRFLKEQPQVADDIIKKWAQSRPSMYRKFLELVKTTGTQGGEESIEEFFTQIAQDLTNFLYQNPDDRLNFREIMTNALSAAKGGFMMGTMLGPISYGSNQASMKMRRKRAGGVNLVQTNDGKVYEVVGGDESDNIYVQDNLGKQSSIKRTDVKDHVYLNTKQMTEVLDGYDKGAQILSQIDQQKQADEIAQADPEQMIRDLGKKYAYNGYSSALSPEWEGNVDRNFIKYGEMKDGRKVIIKSTNFATDPANMLVTIVDAENPESKPEMTKGNMIINSMDVPYEEWVANEMRNYQATMQQVSNETAKATAPVQEGATIPIGEQLFNVTQVTDQGIVLNEIDKEGNLTANSQTITPDKYGEVFGMPAEEAPQAQAPGEQVQPQAEATRQPAGEAAQPTTVSPQSRKVSDGKNEFTIIPQEDGNFRMSESFETQKEAETALKKLQERYPKLTWSAEMTDSGDLFTPDTYNIVAEPKKKPAVPVAEAPKVKPEQKPVEAPKKEKETGRPFTPKEKERFLSQRNAMLDMLLQAKKYGDTPKGVIDGIFDIVEKEGRMKRTPGSEPGRFIIDPQYTEAENQIIEFLNNTYPEGSWDNPLQDMIDEMQNDIANVDNKRKRVVPAEEKQTAPEVKAEVQQPVSQAPSTPDETAAEEEVQNAGEVEIPAPKGVPTYAQKKQIVLDHFGGMYEDAAASSPEQIYEQVPEVTPEDARQIHAEIKSEFEAEQDKTRNAPDPFVSIAKAEGQVDSNVPMKAKEEKPKITTPREAAIDLIRAYVERGDPYESLKGSFLGSIGGRYDAQIGGYLKTKNVKADQIAVSRLNGKEVSEVFSLKELFDEIKAGTKPTVPAKPQKPTEDTRPIKKLKEKKGWPMSKADEARLSREPQSFEEAVYQFFIGRGRISTASLKHHLGTRSREDYASYIWAHKKDGQKTDKLNEAHIFQAHPELLKQTGDQQDQERAFMDILLSVHGLNDMRTRIDEMHRKADEINAEPVAPKAEEEIDYIDAGQVVDEEILPLEEEDPEILRIFELEINELGKTLDDLKNLAANDPDYFQVFPYGLNEKQFNELKSILNDTERQKQIIGLDHEVNQSESRSEGDNEVPGSPEPESRTDGEGREEGGTEEPAISAEQLERERAAIEEWLPTSDHEDYISFEWDGESLEIFKGRDERIVGLSRDQLIEEGVRFPEAVAPAVGLKTSNHTVRSYANGLIDLDKAKEKINLALASLTSGRGFNQSFEDYMEQNPDVRKRNDELEAIKAYLATNPTPEQTREVLTEPLSNAKPEFAGEFFEQPTEPKKPGIDLARSIVQKIGNLESPSEYLKDITLPKEVAAFFNSLRKSPYDRYIWSVYGKGFKPYNASKIRGFFGHVNERNSRMSSDILKAQGFDVNLVEKAELDKIWFKNGVFLNITTGQFTSNQNHFFAGTQVNLQGVVEKQLMDLVNKGLITREQAYEIEQEGFKKEEKATNESAPSTAESIAEVSTAKTLQENYSIEELDDFISQLQVAAKDMLNSGETDRNMKLQELIAKVIDARNLAIASGKQKPENKKPWQMTQEEYYQAHKDQISPLGEGKQGTIPRKDHNYIHKNIVQTAFEKGENIPTKVLDDYPELIEPKKPEFAGEMFENSPEGKTYKYEMLSRPFGIGTYPKQGFVKSENNPQGHFEILTYNRKLTAQEISHWSFLPLTEVQDIKGKNFVDKDGDYSKITLSWFGNDQYANVSMYDQEGNLVEEPFGLKAAEILKNLEEGYWIEKPATQAEGNQSEKKQKDEGIQNIIIQSPEEGHTDAEDNKTAQDELKRGFKVWKTFFREKGTEKWRKAYILSAPFLTKTNALQSAKMQLIADSKNIPIGREKEVFNNFEFKAEEVVKQEEKSSLSPIQQKQIDEINKEYADLISKKQAEIAQAEKAMKDALLKADERNGLFGDTTPVEADEIIGRDEQGFTYNEATRAAVRKPFEEKIAGINKVIEELKREQKGKIDFVLQQQDLFAEVPAEPGEKAVAPENVEADPMQMEYVAASKPTTKIEDFGEHISGAKKELRGQLKKHLDTTDDDILNNSISKVLPPIDYKELVDGGLATAEEAAFLQYFRSEIGPKPTATYKLQRWLNRVNAYKSYLRFVLDKEGFKELSGGLPVMEFIEKNIPEGAMKDLKDQIKLLLDLGFPNDITSLKGYELRFFERSKQKSYDKDRNPIVSQPDTWAIIAPFSSRGGRRGGRMIVKDFPSREEAVAGLKYILTTESERVGQVKFDMWRERGRKGIFVGKKVGPRKFITLATGFDKVSEAQKYIKEHQEELEKMLEERKIIPYERPESRGPREGKDYRGGKDVTPEMFSETFGFRGVQFGNYVEQLRRQEDLNEAYDALMDLAEVIGVSPKALSLAGELGVAFGARGSGGKNAAAAHYEPDNIVINLTKGNGPGSLAHEWFHAVDSYFSRIRGERTGFVTERPRQRIKSDGTKDESIRPEVLEAFKGVTEAIENSGMRTRARELDKLRSKDYWTQIIEMAARSFEAYVHNRLVENGGRNDYLVSYKDMVDYIVAAGGSQDKYPYPTNEELGPISEAFDNLFQTIQTREEDGKVAMFRTIGEKGASAVEGLLDNLTVAREMEQTGRSAKEVFLATGWQRGADGLWRYETRDIELKKGIDFIGKLKPQNEAYTEEVPLTDIVEDEELFNSYPELKDVKLTFYNYGSYPELTGTGAFSTFTKKVIAIGTENMAGTKQSRSFFPGRTVQARNKTSLPALEERDVYAYDRASFITNLSHELQHYIQRIEGFAEGTARDYAVPGSSFDERYRLSAGEVEARNVQQRTKLSPEERRELMLSETEDVDREQQIIIRNAFDRNESRGIVPKSEEETGWDALNRILAMDEADDQRHEVKLRIESLSRELNTPVKAINNRNELPPRVQAQAKRIGVWENETMYGAWDEQTGTMYVLMDDLMKLGPQMAAQEGVKTVLHEAVAHKGLPILLGDRGYDNLVSEIYDSIPDDDLTLIRYQYGWTEDKRLIAEEYLGMMAEDNVNPSLFQRIVAKIRQLLRKYFKVAYSKNDVYTLLRASRKNLENAPEEERGFYRSRPQPENFEYAGEFVQAQGTYFRTRKAASVKRNSPLGKAAEAYMEKAAKRTGEETVQGIREYIQDLSLPIRRFEEELLKRGGKQDNNSKPYRDMSLSFGRQEKLYNDYFEGKMKPVLQAVADIKRAGMKGEDILPYIIAKHAIERNQAFRSRELKEWVESHKENVPQDEVDAKMEELKDKDYSGVMGFDTEKKYTNPDELARDIVSEFEGQVDQKLISNLWNKIEGATSEILDTWERGHQITPDQKQEYLSQFRYFVPLRGWREGAAKELVYTKGDGFSRSLQYAKGRKSLADNPLAYLLNVQFQAIAEQVDNEVKTSMVNLIIKNLSNNEMHEMATIKKLYYVKITLPDGTEEWEPTTTRPPQGMFDAGYAKTKIYSEHERLRKPRQAREHEVYVRKPGGDMVMVFNGKHLSTAQAMNKQNYMYRTIFGNIYDARDLNKVMALMGHMNNMLKALYTSWNVVFPFTNFMRDFQEASITQQIKSKSGGKVIKNYRAAFPAIIRRIQGKQNLSNPMDQQLEDFYNLGGATGYTHMKSPEEIEEDINKEVARMVRKGSIAGGIGDAGHALFAAVEHWNKIFEDATRFSVYLSSFAIGNSKQDAAMDAKEASVNFNRKGKGSKAWDAWFAFFNVAVQSMQKNFKLAKDTPKRFTQIAFSFVMLGFLEAMMNALTDDEDDPDSSYYNLNSYMRQNYLVIPLPQIGNLRKKGNKYLSIPLPQFWRGFKSIGSIGFDVATGRMKAGEAVTTALGNFAGGLLPIDVAGFWRTGEFSLKSVTASLMPTISKPILEAAFNQNYMGYTIKKEPFTREQKKYLANAGLGKDNVNPAAKFFTDMLFRWSGGDSRYKYYTDKQGRTKKVLLDVNPSTVEHLFKGYTGGTGGVFSDLLTTVSQALDPDQEVDFKNVPFVDRFLRKTPPAKWNIISEYYDLKEANDRDITLMKEYERQGRETGNISQYERMAEDEYRIERKMIFDSYEDQISDLTKGVTKDDMESSSLVIEQMDMCIGEIKRLEARYKRKY